HQLHRERQATQMLDLLNRVLLRLTDEIKNPLVSIYTFLELLPQRYDDPEFRETFLSVVGKDTQRLISLVDKLITLAGEREYKPDFCDLRDVLHDALDEVAVRLERSRTARASALFLISTPERPDQLTAMLYAPDDGLVVLAEREHLFSPLAIASDKLLDVGPGVTQKIVEAHGGNLTLGGQDGEIRFVLSLPRTHHRPRGEPEGERAAHTGRR